MEMAPISTDGAGPRPRVPVAFGEYEVGRTSMPWVRNMPSPWSLDGRDKHPALEPTGDPGAYDPYAYGFASDKVRREGYNKKRPAFDATEVRRLAHRILGEASGALTYNVMEAENAIKYPAVDSQRSVFASRSLQRPSSRSHGPGPAGYMPQFGAVEANLSNTVCCP